MNIYELGNVQINHSIESNQTNKIIFNFKIYIFA